MSDLRGKTKMNFLLILVDQLRKPPAYESDEIKQWREKYLIGQQTLRKTSIEFDRHYIASTACSPSRASLFTGHYPSLHGVTQTWGMAKRENDPDISWLDPNGVPTMGEYFQRNGYRTYYKGKWHLSHADIVHNHKVLHTIDQVTGESIERNVSLYKNSNRLRDFGFDDWIGPEPHGSNPYNSATSSSIGNGQKGRDAIFASQVIDLINELSQDKEEHKDPWLIVASLLNPHDISLFGDITQKLPMFNFPIDPTVPDIPESPTDQEDLTTKPSAQESYRDILPQALQKISDHKTYRSVYYSLEKYVDEQVKRIMDALQSSSMYKDTIVIFTSDHGEQLGSHGGLIHKWHNFYEESARVPLIIHNPILFPNHQVSYELSSHIDLIPTMLSLAGISEKQTRKCLEIDHCEVRPLVGKILKTYDIQSIDKLTDHVVYFWTQDNPTFGQLQISESGVEYQAIVQPNSVEAVLVYLFSRFFNNPHLLKFVRYYDPMGKAEDEYELYDLTEDPYEQINLMYMDKNRDDMDWEEKNRHFINRMFAAQCKAILDEQRNIKLLQPQHQSTMIGFDPITMRFTNLS